MFYYPVNQRDKIFPKYKGDNNKIVNQQFGRKF